MLKSFIYTYVKTLTKGKGVSSLTNTFFINVQFSLNPLLSITYELTTKLLTEHKKHYRTLSYDIVPY